MELPTDSNITVKLHFDEGAEGLVVTLDDGRW